MKILFKYPTYGRAEWFKSTLEKYYEMISGKHDYEFIISCNEDDLSMNNEKMIEYMSSKPNLKFYFGPHKNKIEAINADMGVCCFDILFLISDDMIPVVKNFDEIIVTKMNEHFPNLDGALHFNDGCCGKDKTITLSILGVNLYNWFGYIYHPAYKSFYCDNEFTDEVRKLDKVVYFKELIVSHNWKGGGGGDTVYKRNTKLGKGDANTYNRRKKMGFPK